MSAWFLDASVLLACEDTDDRQHDDARRLLEGPAALATLDLALYEVTNVAIVAWSDAAAALRLRRLIGAVTDDGGLVRADAGLLATAADLAVRHSISVYDAAYVAAAAASATRLVSCDDRHLVSRGLAVAPAQAHAP